MKIEVFKLAIFNNPTIKANASITIEDAIAINDIVLKQTDEGKYILKFPTKEKQGERYNIVHPVSFEIRNQIFSAILAAYQKALQEKYI